MQFGSLSVAFTSAVIAVVVTNGIDKVSTYNIDWCRMDVILRRGDLIGLPTPPATVVRIFRLTRGVSWGVRAADSNGDSDYKGVKSVSTQR